MAARKVVGRGEQGMASMQTKEPWLYGCWQLVQPSSSHRTGMLLLLLIKRVCQVREVEAGQGVVAHSPFLFPLPLPLSLPLSLPIPPSLPPSLPPSIPSSIPPSLHPSFECQGWNSGTLMLSKLLVTEPYRSTAILLV